MNRIHVLRAWPYYSPCETIYVGEWYNDALTAMTTFQADKRISWMRWSHFVQVEDLSGVRRRVNFSEVMK